MLVVKLAPAGPQHPRNINLATTPSGRLAYSISHVYTFMYAHMNTCVYHSIEQYNIYVYIRIGIQAL